MPGQFDKETSSKNYEWHRERILREKKRASREKDNRVNWNLKSIAEKHGVKAAREMEREFRSK